MFLRSKSTSQTEVVNLLILVTFQIKDFEGHYLKLVVHRGFTEFCLRNIFYFNDIYFIEDLELITN